jgi:tetratricopeptide (TPR) repeat protein/sugar lactone lactonase YvrE
MTRRTPSILAVGAVLALFAACDSPEEPAGDASDASVVAEADLADFVTEIERLVNGAVERVIAQGSGAAAPASLRARIGRRVPDGEPLEREFEVTAAGRTGNVAATGLAFTRPWPARYEMALSLADFSETEALTANGGVLYNFIRDDREATAQSHGLFRARLTLAGRFAGSVDLHGEMDAGKIVSLVVLTGASRARLVFGREPRAVVTYVSTVAGTGGPGSADGGRNVGELSEPSGVVVDRSGRVFIADTGNKAVRELSPSGELTTLATAFEEPWDLGFDGLGLLVVSDRASRSNDGQGAISRIFTGGELKGLVVRTVAKVGDAENGIPYCTGFWCDGRSPLAHMTYAGGIDVEGSIVTVAQTAVPESLRLVTPDGTTLTLRHWTQGGCTPEVPGAPHDVVQGRTGELYFTTDCHAVWALRQDGTVEPVAGAPTRELGFADGVGADAKFSYPAGIVSDGEYLYLTESNGSRVRRVEIATGATLRIAGCLDDTPGFDCVLPTGFRDGPGDYAQFHNPENLALDPWGDLYVADTDNHAIRFVRLANDPERRPTITQLQPISLQQGAEATLTIRGRDLGLVRTAELGAGIAAEIVERSAKRVKVRVRVAEDAPTGAHALTVTTPFGSAAAPARMALNVLAERASRARVRTIAGTDETSTPGIQDILPAETSQFGFPGGIAAIDRERILIADPMEHRIKLIATKQGAARELLELAVYEGGGQLGLTILQGIEGFEDIAGNVLGAFGVDNFTSAPREEILRSIERSLDAICEAARSDCEYLSLPWAGVMAAPGNSGGFRLGARLALPTDVAVVADQQFVIADTANRAIKTVGIDFSGTDPKPAPYQVANADYLQDYPLTVVSTAADTAIAATSTDSTLAKLTLRDGSSVLSPWAGVRDAFRCRRGDNDARHPLGVPMGMARGDAGTLVADPYCGTIWVVDGNGEAQDIRGELKPPFNPLPDCSDGPLIYATFSKPMDVAVDSQGNIWVADPGCHSIRVIKPAGIDDLRAALEDFSGGIAGWFDSDVAEAVVARVSSSDLGEFDAARMWVTTVAGSADGEAGFRDGAATEALFNAPVSLAIAEEDGETYIFVSDAGNRRIRLIDLSARVEATTRTEPQRGGGTPDRPPSTDGPAGADDAGNAFELADLDPYNAGIVHASEARWIEAADAFLRAIALDPQDVDAHVQLGNVWLQLEQPAEATEAFRTALALDVVDDEAHSGLVTAFGTLQRYEEMAAAAAAWSDISPSVDAYMALGTASTYLDDYEAAAAAFEQALVLDADSADAHFNLGVAELALERHESAAQHFRRTTELNPQASGAYTNLGVALLALGQHEEALVVLQQAIELDLESGAAHYNRALAYVQTGRLTEALAELERVRQLDETLASDLERRIGQVNIR